jgi:hypothetical protein
MKRIAFSCLLPMALLTAAVLLIAGPAQAGCYAHRPKYIEGIFEVRYDSGCSGHDEPELDPVSSAPGSARELTWKVVLPSGGAFPVSATGPTFWFGGTVTDPRSIFGQSFVELQFYPDSIVTSCSQSGGFEVKFAPNTYSVCSPVWRLTSTGQKGVFHETAAFNAMLTDGTGPNTPLIMNAGDTITVHWFTTPAQDGFHVTVTDLTINSSGTIVLNSTSTGPLMPAFDTQTIGNALAWGSVSDTPNSLYGRLGTNPFLPARVPSASLGRPVATHTMRGPGQELRQFKFSPSPLAMARNRRNGPRLATWVARRKSWQTARLMVAQIASTRGIRSVSLASTSASISRIPSRTSARQINTRQLPSAAAPSERIPHTATRS